MKSLLDCLARCQGAIDSFTEFSGRLISWLTVVMMLATCGVVLLRYVLGSGSIAFQETIIYLHATLFLMGIAYTLKRDGHVRVDIFYRRFSARARAWVDLFGCLLLLLPVTVLIFVLCWDYVWASWSIREASGDPKGLPWVYYLKTLLLLMPVSVLIQAVGEILKNILVIAGHAQPRAYVADEARI